MFLFSPKCFHLVLRTIVASTIRPTPPDPVHNCLVRHIQVFSCLHFSLFDLVNGWMKRVEVARGSPGEFLEIKRAVSHLLAEYPQPHISVLVIPGSRSVIIGEPQHVYVHLVNPSDSSLRLDTRRVSCALSAGFAASCFSSHGSNEATEATCTRHE